MREMPPLIDEFHSGTYVIQTEARMEPQHPCISVCQSGASTKYYTVILTRGTDGPARSTVTCPTPLSGDCETMRRQTNQAGGPTKHQG